MLPEIKDTSLNLLASDGAISVTFEPMLNAVQYNELAEFVLNDPLRTRHELCDQLAQFANEWGVGFKEGDVNDG